MARRLHFFATGADLRPALEAVERAERLRYLPTGLFETPPQPRDSLLDLPGLGIATTGEWNSEPSYLVTRRDNQVSARRIPQRRGGVLWALDQLVNPTSVRLLPGGVMEREALLEEEARLVKRGIAVASAVERGLIIAGKVDTASGDPGSLALFRLFLKEFTKRFRRIQAVWLGPEAEARFDNGARLTCGVGWSIECDLRRG